jgi:hypothetical protein
MLNVKEKNERHKNVSAKRLDPFLGSTVNSAINPTCPVDENESSYHNGIIEIYPHCRK